MAALVIGYRRFLLKAIFILLLLLLGMAKMASAQQSSHYSMYMFNPYYTNPAYAGVHYYIHAQMVYRKQWVNFPGSPVYQNFTGIYPYKRKNLAFGINLNNDITGARNNFKMNLGAAHTLRFKKGALAFGANLGIQTYRMNWEELENPNVLAPTSSQGSPSVTLPDAGMGVMFKNDRWFAGFSALHLNGPGMKLSGYSSGSVEGSVARHYYLTAGYIIEVDPKFNLIPSVISRYSESRLFTRNQSTDFNVRLEYQQMIWFGAGYRTGDAMTFMTGINTGKINPDVFRQNIKVGYAFDWTSSRLPTYNIGTHEIFVSFDYIPKPKRAMPKFK